MKQVVIRKAGPVVVDSPAPAAIPGFVLVKLRASCISPGTELAGISAAGKNLFQKAIAQPGKVGKAIQDMQALGVGAVWERACRAIDKESGCGYSAAGVVLDVGPGVEGIYREMKVAVAGAGHANHAEIVAVPRNLTVPMPSDLSFGEASTVALGGIAMQGIRRAGVAIGERVAVIGCGALGMLAIQILKAAGCRVFAVDLQAQRLELASKLGAEIIGNSKTEDIVKLAMHWSGGHGIDSALVFAATHSSEPLSQAFRMCRRKGRVVLVGIAGNEYKREDMYAKELDFLISTSYGPGRYDDGYELEGRDYPFGYVRWTENRNMAAYLDLLSRHSVSIDPLIGARYTVENAAAAYDSLNSPDRPLLVVLDYPDDAFVPECSSPSLPDSHRAPWISPAAAKSMGVALVGAGSFVQTTHLPILRGLPHKFGVLWSCSRAGITARSAANLLPGCKATTNYEDILQDPAVDIVLIATRHNTHADLAIRALHSGKAVFLEKPMCLTVEEFDAIYTALEATNSPFLVGYNRRFSPFAQNIRSAVSQRTTPLMIQYTVNAGYLPPTHWTQTKEGGGRLLGEACHMVDLFRSLVGHPVLEISCTPLRGENPTARPADNFCLTVSYSDGSVACLTYTALGHNDIPKERMQVFFDEKAFEMDDYMRLIPHGVSSAPLRLKIQSKGHSEEWAALYDEISKGKRFPIPWEELAETWKVTCMANSICLQNAS